MMNKLINKKALTLMETLVAGMIMAITLAGLVNLFVAGKRHILHSRSRMAGGEIGKAFIEPLQLHVRQDTWDTADNALTETGGTPRFCGGTPSQPAGFCPPGNINFIEYSAQYVISNLTATDPDIRKVVTTISWVEPSQ
ncbi:MAG: hypothetical protein AB1481_00415 [Candidatus Omnitrophota bacterium]